MTDHQRPDERVLVTENPARPRGNEPDHDRADHVQSDYDQRDYAVEAEYAEPGEVEEVRQPDVQLFTEDEVDRFREQWRALQVDFVDSPREAVHRADELVAQVIQSLATTFAEHKRSLEGQWQEGERVDTEELRLALRRYRSFFERLTSV
ncbi:hypothetical protein [Saccharothrix coeruleofusca]|uniref:Uncharacterized protein n=1 Tax=Saccharothrix coeruleofusca TaxID=33919 RepID=A0A918ECI5_9PSEU|nr:hypothetical protein [Saccharothrix coeruleofusca]MBP2334501.1 hypothetical protein [Saccharothrix coeruleofusca]GGP40579.1 hypothetical protein GCM10010185_09550 [Saccharothrix coeruleofusca]